MKKLEKLQQRRRLSLRPAIALGLLSLCLTGCVGQVMRIDPVTNTNNIDVMGGRRIAAKASGFQLLGVLSVGTNTRQQKAFEALREQAGDDVIADVILRESWYYAFFGTVFTTSLEAMAYPRKPKLH